MRDYQSAHRRSKQDKKLRNKDRRKLALFSWLKKLSLFLIFFIILIIVLTKIFVDNFFSLEGSFNLIFATNKIEKDNPVFLVVFNPTEEKIEVRELDANLQVDLVGGYGSYRLQAIYPLLKLEGKDDDFIKSVYSLAVETVVDDVITIDNHFWIKEKKDISKLLSQKLIEQIKDKQFSETTLNLFLFSLKPGLVLNFNKVTKQEDLEIVGGSSIIDSCPIAVVNTTKTQGLANKISKVLEDNGFLVVRNTNDHLTLENTKIYYDDKMGDCSKTLLEVTKIVPNSLPNDIDKQLTEKYRAGIVIMLGKDIDSN